MNYSDTLLQRALAVSRIGCFEWDLQTQQLNGNDELYRLFGLDASAHAPAYQPLFALIKKEDIPLLNQAFEQALQHKKLTSVEFTVTHPDASEHILEAKGQVQADENGNISKLIGTLQDITAHKLTQKDLLARERQIRFIVESVPAMVWTGYGENKKEYVNRWMIQYTGVPAEQLMEDRWLKVVHPDDRQIAVAAQANSLKTGQPYQLELRFRRADGTYRWHIMHAVPYRDEAGRLTKLIGINADIEEQKLKEQALRENKTLREVQQSLLAEMEFSESILENSLNGVLALNKQGQITKWNKHMEFLSGRKKEEVMGKTIPQLYPAYKESEENKAIEKALQGQKVTFTKHRNPFGIEEGIYQTNLIPLLIGGVCTGVLGTIYEVTEIVRLEQAQTNLKLNQQKEILNAILQVQERERERIAESLYNGLGQLLFAARLNLQVVNSSHLQPETQPLLSKVNTLLNEAIRQSRTVSFELVPPMLKDFGLQPTLEDLAEVLSSPAIVIHVQTEGLTQRLDFFLEISIFRMIRTLFSNVIEHAGASQIMLMVSKSENNIHIQVKDNGQERSYSGARPAEGNLQTVSHRVALLNGTLTIDSGSGRGTSITVMIPLPQPI